MKQSVTAQDEIDQIETRIMIKGTEIRNFLREHLRVTKFPR